MSRSRLKVNTTSRPVKGWPSCHFTFLRRKKVYIFASGDTSQRSARSGITVLRSVSVFARVLKMFTKMIWRIKPSQNTGIASPRNVIVVML